MKRKLRAAVFALLVGVIVVFLIPIVPYRSSYYVVGGGTYNWWESHVSTSYALTGCGLLYGTNLDEEIVGNGSWHFMEVMPLLMLTCLYHPTQIIGHLS